RWAPAASRKPIVKDRNGSKLLASNTPPAPAADAPTALLRSRWSVLASACLLFLAATCFYSGVFCLDVLQGLALEGVIAAIWLLAAILTGWTILRRLHSGASFALQLCTAAGLGAGILGLIILALGMSGFMSRILAIVLLAGAILLGGADLATA